MRTREEIQTDTRNAFALLLEVMLDVREIMLEARAEVVRDRVLKGELKVTTNDAS